jgi:tRNA(Ile)-lysidine synthase
MLHLAAGLDVRVVTVDHGLRPEAAAEAAAVGRVCAALGVPHQVLQWQWDGRGNLQDAARRGRRAVMADWARRFGVAAVALAHTQDDVAETFVMRLARGAGVDGLAAMSARWDEAGVVWLRPLLAVTRAQLRDHLRGIGAVWVEDPSNDNLRFDRVKVRKALAVLGPLGVTPQRLAEVAGHLAEVRAALEVVTGALTVRALHEVAGAVRIDREALAVAAPEVQRRLVLRVIGAIASDFYAPRGAAVQALLGRLLAGQGGTLAGCRFQVLRGQLWAFREGRAVAGVVCAPGQVWDGRWRMTGPVGHEVRALGEGLLSCPDWRATGVPRGALLASPSLWLGPRLIAAPHAGLMPQDGAISLFPVRQMQQTTISH